MFNPFVEQVVKIINKSPLISTVHQRKLWPCCAMRLSQTLCQPRDQHQSRPLVFKNCDNVRIDSVRCFTVTPKQIVDNSPVGWQPYLKLIRLDRPIGKCRVCVWLITWFLIYSKYECVVVLWTVFLKYMMTMCQMLCRYMAVIFTLHMEHKSCSSSGLPTRSHDTGPIRHRCAINARRWLHYQWFMGPRLWRKGNHTHGINCNWYTDYTVALLLFIWDV